VQAARRLAHDLAQPRLDIHVHVFEALVHLEAALFDLLAQLEKAGEDLFHVRLRDDPLLAQHARVRYRPAHVLERDPLVDGKRRGVGFDGGVRGLGEATAPRLLRLRWFVRHGLHSTDARFGVPHARLDREGDKCL